MTHAQSRPYQHDGRLHGAIAGCPRASDGRWLLIRRSARVAAPGRICFPGGAVELNEAPAQSVVREVQEELGLAVRPLKQVWRFLVSERNLLLHGFLVEPIDGPIDGTRELSLSPDPAEVAQVLWLSREEIRADSDVMPNTERFVAALEAARPTGLGRDGADATRARSIGRVDAAPRRAEEEAL